MREEDLGRLDESLMEDLAEARQALDGDLMDEVTLLALKRLIRSSKIEQRFVGGLDNRRLATFCLIEQSKLAEILGEE